MDEKKILKQLDNVKTDMDKLLKRYYDSSENGVIGIIDKVNTAVETVNEASQKVDTFADSISANTEKINENSAKITENTTKIEENSQKIETNTTNIATNTEHIAANTTTLADHTEQLRNHENAITAIGWTYRESISVRLNDLETKEIQASDNIDVLRDGLLTADEQKEVTNTVHTEQSKKRNEFLKVILPKIRSHVDSSTGESTDYSAEIQAINSQIASINSKLAKIEIPTDPNYTGKTFTDYPAGTIIQTYDYDERNYNFSSTQSITTPTLYFCTEQSAVAKITITSNVSLQTAGTVKIKTFLNDSLIDEHNFELQNDCSLQQVSFDIYDANLSTASKANNIYTSIFYNKSSNNTITLKNQKVEIIASNIMFLNKLCPFDALYFDGKYHLTDCSGGTIKTAEIKVENMHNIDDLTWTDTLIPAQECQSTGSYNAFTGGNLEIGELYHMKRTLENKFYIGTLEDNFEKKIFPSILEMDYVTQFDKSIYFVARNTSNNGINTPYFDPTRTYVGISSSRANVPECVKLSGQRYYGDISNKVPVVNIKHNNNGECYIQDDIISSGTLSYKLADGNISSLIIKNYISTSKFDISAYIHHFDKTIRYDISYNKSATEPFTVNSIKEMGTYDKVFEMPNNYYFAVKNNKFYYYKLQDTETTEENS